MAGFDLLRNSVIVVAAVVFVCSSKLFTKSQPQGSPIADAARLIHVVITKNGVDNAKPSALREPSRIEKYSIASDTEYADQIVQEVKSGIAACKVSTPVSRNKSHKLMINKLFLLFPFYFICCIQIWNNLISQPDGAARNAE